MTHDFSPTNQASSANPKSQPDPGKPGRSGCKPYPVQLPEFETEIREKEAIYQACLADEAIRRRG